MSDQFKISGKKLDFPEVDSSWNFTSRPGGWVIAERTLESGKKERKRIAIAQLKGILSANLAGIAWHGEIVSTSRSSAGVSGGGDSDLVAQFPGKVRKILVQEGQSVQEGDSLLLVEAMKMEFAVKAPFSGTVKKILVQENQQLSPGSKFLDLEAKNSGS